MNELLSSLKSPEQLMEYSTQQLEQIAAEVRDRIIKTVAGNGGHLASNLGMVELTVALLAEFDFRRDKIVFDVGHQSYTWKLLTGRNDRFDTLRKKDGLSGFPKRSESPYDFFNTGHSSTSISAALGLVRAGNRTARNGHVIALIGDGALTGGMAFEALNDAGQSKDNLIVVLNDNQMSIGKNVGGLSHHLENLRISRRYMRLKSSIEAVLLKLPVIGKGLHSLLQQIKRLDRFWLRSKGVFFEQLGFRYYGPIDGHDINDLRQHLGAIREMNGPVLLHVLTQKGKGYAYAEEAPDIYHGVAPFVIEKGVCKPGKIKCNRTFSEAFGRAMLDLARNNSRICTISAAMTSGTGLMAFAEQYPARFFDVGIAEQHAVTMAAGMAAGGIRPVIALYATFLQRAYDQLLHDICLQRLPVTLAIDRAGLVGEDGETHQGIYDLGLLLPLPNLEVYCPLEETSLRQVLNYAVQSDQSIAIRYPRASMPDAIESPAVCHDERPPSGYLVRSGNDCTVISLGVLFESACEAVDLLLHEGITCDVFAIIRAKPFDVDLVRESLKKTGRLLIMEDGLLAGGFAESILTSLMKLLPELAFHCMGVTAAPLEQASRFELLQSQGLDPNGMAAAIRTLSKSPAKN